MLPIAVAKYASNSSQATEGDTMDPKYGRSGVSTGYLSSWSFDAPIIRDGFCRDERELGGRVSSLLLLKEFGLSPPASLCRLWDKLRMDLATSPLLPPNMGCTIGDAASSMLLT
jgi:hypothetical protein